MKMTDTEKLTRLLNGELSHEDAAQLRAELVRSPALQAELEQLETMQHLLQMTVKTEAETALKPFFADRLMRKLAPTLRRVAPEEILVGALMRVFRPVALVGLLVILLLSGYNLTRSGSYEAGQTTTEAVLGLPPVALATAYELDF